MRSAGQLHISIERSEHGRVRGWRMPRKHQHLIPESPPFTAVIATASSDFSANSNTLWSQETPLRISTLDSRFPPIPKEFDVSPKAQNLCLLLVILPQGTQGDKKMSVSALLTFDWVLLVLKWNFKSTCGKAYTYPACAH